MAFRHGRPHASLILVVEHFLFELAVVRTWQQALHRFALQAIEARHLRVDTDADQLVCEMYGLILGLHHDARFLNKARSVERAQRGFNCLIDSYRNIKPVS